MITYKMEEEVNIIIICRYIDSPFVNSYILKKNFQHILYI